MMNNPSFCQIHKERVAIGVCIECHTSVCLECEVSHNGKRYCKGCAAPFLVREKIHRRRNPVLAATLALVVPGLGQIYNGQMGKGMCVFLTWWLILPWIYGIFDAFQAAKKVEQGKISSHALDFLLEGLVVFFMILFGPLLIWKTSGHVWRYVVHRIEDVSVQERLIQMSQAMERYAHDHGQYPRNEADVHFDKKDHLKMWYCDVMIGDYQYSCAFSVEGYTITASPMQTSAEKLAYAVTQGAVISELPNSQGAEYENNGRHSRGYYGSGR